MLDYYMFDKSCKNLLVRGVNWIGDAVMTLPALRVLRKAMPETKITLLVKPWVAPIFEKDPNIDEIIIYGDEYKGIIGKIKLSRVLNKKDFCSAILFQNAFDAALITFLGGIKERVGYNRDSRGFLLTKAVPLPENKAHQIYYYLNLLKEIEINPVDIINRVNAEYSEPYIYLTLDERLHARKILSGMKRPIIGINPGAAYGSAKRWFPEKFAEVAKRFIKDTNGSVVIFGGKNEVDVAQEIEIRMIRSWEYKNFSTSQPHNFLTSHLLNLAGRTSLRELIAIISECDVFVTNDSGPMHIAYAVRTPLVAIFGSTDPELTGPIEGGNVVIKADVDCAPCFERTCKSDMRCMYGITSDDVYYGIKKILPDRPAVFFDRDGTLCRDVGYLDKYDDFHIFSNIDSVRLLKERGFKLIGVSNQSGISRGIIEEDFVNKINRIFIERYDFDGFYYCPHHPDEHCPCRKPEPGMLLWARAEHRVNLKRSYMVGDKQTDMLIAKAVGAKGILVQTGEAKESANADYIARDLKEAVDFISRNNGNK
ncbi:MAG: lipopolysaccharide heptosyltransferase II [Nitrospirota bacterium]